MVEILAPILSVIIVSLISLIGIFFLAFKTKALQKTLIILVGFSVGALLGNVFLHLLPELAEDVGFTLATSLSILSGIVVFFILEKFVQWRHCHEPNKKHLCTKEFATINLVGDAFHNLIDGMIIAGSYVVDFRLGIVTTLAVLLHEIPQEIGDFAILLHAGMTKTKALTYNFISALFALVGAIVVLALNGGISLNFIVPFTAGGFIYLAGADLLPELHKVEYSLKSSVIQLVSVLAGMAVMFGLLFVG